MRGIDQFTNGARATIVDPIDGVSDPVDVTVAPGLGARFPAEAPFSFVVDNEILRSMEDRVVGDVLRSCYRAQEGTTKAAHVAGATIVAAPTAKHIETIFNRMLVPDAPTARALWAPSWDDGYKSHILEVAPLANELLQQHTFCSNPGLWGTNPSLYMDEDDIVILDRMGHELGSHTMHHTRMSNVVAYIDDASTDSFEARANISGTLFQIEHGLKTDQEVLITGTPVAPLAAGTSYYVIATSTTVFQLAAAPGTGTPIDISATGHMTLGVSQAVRAAELDDSIDAIVALVNKYPSSFATPYSARSATTDREMFYRHSRILNGENFPQKYLSLREQQSRFVCTRFAWTAATHPTLVDLLPRIANKPVILGTQAHNPGGASDITVDQMEEVMRLVNDLKIPTVGAAAAYGEGNMVVDAGFVA